MINAQLESDDPKHPNSFECRKLPTKITRRVQQLYKTREFFDVLLKSSDNIEMQVHRVILCSSSEWFLGKFKGMPDTPKPMRIEVEEFASVILEPILQFMYTSSVNLCTENVKEVLQAADHFKMVSLMDICCSFMKQEFNSGNCLSTAIFAKKHGYSKLSEDSLSFVYTNFEKICFQKDFLELDSEMLDDILCEDKLNVFSEEIVVRSLLGWLENNRENREHSWLDRLSNIRYQFLTQEFIVENTDSICINLDCHKLIRRWLKWHFLPEKRSKAECALVKPRNSFQTAGLTIISGYETDDLQIQTYFPEFNYWTCKSMPPFGENLNYSSIIVEKDEVIIVGGVNIYGIRTNEVKYFNIKSEESGMLPSMKTPRSSAGIAMLGGYLYIVGGRSLVKDKVKTITSVERYNFTTEKWQDVESLIDPICGAETGVLGSFLVVFDSHSLQWYNPTDNVWKVVDLEVQKSEFSFTVADKQLYITGGMLRNELNCATIERLDFSTYTWHIITSLKTPCRQSKCVAYKDSLLVIGGYNCGKWLNTVKEYNLKTNVWKSLAPLHTACLDIDTLLR